MPLHERAAARVLPGEPDRGALEQQRAEREQLAVAPVDPALARHLRPLLEQLAQLRVHGEGLRRRDVRVADPLEHLERDRGLALRRGGGVVALLGGGLLEAAGGVGPVGGPRVGRGRGLAGLGEHPLQLLLVVLERRLGLLDGDVAAADERLGVDLAHRALALDQRVHQRLGHRRVVALVVAATAVADHVDDDVLLELLPEVERQLGHPGAGLGVVAVHVEDRRLDHLADVGAVERRAAGRGRGGEADLVVHDDVHRCRRCGSRAAATGSGSRRPRPARRTRRRRASARAAPGTTRRPCSAGPAWRARRPRGPG